MHKPIKDQWIKNSNMRSNLKGVCIIQFFRMVILLSLFCSFLFSFTTSLQMEQTKQQHGRWSCAYGKWWWCCWWWSPSWSSGTPSSSSPSWMWATPSHPKPTEPAWSSPGLTPSQRRSSAASSTSTWSAWKTSQGPFTLRPFPWKTPLPSLLHPFNVMRHGTRCTTGTRCMISASPTRTSPIRTTALPAMCIRMLTLKTLPPAVVRALLVTVSMTRRFTACPAVCPTVFWVKGRHMGWATCAARRTAIRLWLCEVYYTERIPWDCPHNGSCVYHHVPNIHSDTAWVSPAVHVAASHKILSWQPQDSDCECREHGHCELQEHGHMTDCEYLEHGHKTLTVNVRNMATRLWMPGTWPQDWLGTSGTQLDCSAQDTQPQDSDCEGQEHSVGHSCRAQNTQPQDSDCTGQEYRLGHSCSAQDNQSQDSNCAGQSLGHSCSAVTVQVDCTERTAWYRTTTLSFPNPQLAFEWALGTWLALL